MKLLVGLVVGLVVLSGCSGGDPEPKVVPTQSVASTPSVSPTEVESSDPPQALSPVQTVRAWVKARNAALQDGDTTAADEFAAPNCESCFNSTDSIRNVYQAGGHFETKGWRVVAAKVKSMKAGSAVVDSAIRYEAGRTFPQAGSDPVSYAVERHIVVFKLTRIDEEWRIRLVLYLS